MQGVVGSMTSVAMGCDGTVWVLTRGGRPWLLTSYDLNTNKLLDESPINADVVFQLQPDTGVAGGGAGQGRTAH